MLSSAATLRPSATFAVRRCAAKLITAHAPARQQILKGCSIMADTVGATLGPRGRNVIIEQSYGPPKISKDGVTVAKAIDLEDKLQNLGASLLKGVAQATNDASGDGTTTATVLAREIYRAGCEAVAAGLNPMDLLRGMKKATDAIRKYLESQSKPVTSSADIFNIAKISANGDEVIGNLISTAMERVGRDNGTITVTEGKSLTHELSIVEGYEFDRGYLSSFFINDLRSQKCDLENPMILLMDEKLSNVQPLIPLLEHVLANNQQLLIIAEDIDSEVLATLVVNRLRGGLKVCVTKAPGFGDSRKRQLEDVAILTGGTLVSKETGRKLDSIKPNDLGRARRVRISKDTTLILEGNSNARALKERITTLQAQLADTELSAYERTKLQERLAKLTGGVAVIQVGGASELEVAEAKDRVDDALCATRAAVESGVLAGGGSALLFASQCLENLKGNTLAEDTGIKIIKNACLTPLKLIVQNAGHEGAVVAGNLLREHKYGYGFDAQTCEYVDMTKAGILDPAKVVLTALTDAASVAALMCTTEAAICIAPEKADRSSALANQDLDM